MDWTRRLLRHRQVYRTMNLPFYISQRWESVDEIRVVYDEQNNEVTIQPLSGKLKAKAASTAAPQAKAASKAETAASVKVVTSKPDQDHTPDHHSRISRIGFE